MDSIGGRLILFAPGAGAPSSSGWMQRWRQYLERLAPVRPFDYPYQLAGRRSPDRQPVLIEAHRAAFSDARAAAERIIFAGKSMGSRIGCHVAVEAAERGLPSPSALICLGYPLVGGGGAVRDEVLLKLKVPILFVQGSRDRLCPLELLQKTRERMTAPNELHIVQGGDHSLTLSKRGGASNAQQASDEAALLTISRFIDGI